MTIILLIGAAYNIVGGLFALFTPPIRGEAQSEFKSGVAHGDYVQSRIFLSGAAITFGALYAWLWWHQELVWPILIFGAFLKYWAFGASLVAWRRHGLATSAFIQFGIMNGLIAIGFTAYLASL